MCMMVSWYTTTATQLLLAHHLVSQMCCYSAHLSSGAVSSHSTVVTQSRLVTWRGFAPTSTNILSFITMSGTSAAALRPWSAPGPGPTTVAPGSAPAAWSASASGSGPPVTSSRSWPWPWSGVWSVNKTTSYLYWGSNMLGQVHMLLGEPPLWKGKGPKIWGNKTSEKFG